MSEPEETYEEAQARFDARRDLILEKIRQLKIDTASYNDNFRTPGVPRLEMSFDFTEELRAEKAANLLEAIRRGREKMSRSRSYSMDAVALWNGEDGEITAYATQGHHDGVAFVRLVNRQYGTKFDGEDARQVYRRMIPRRGSGLEEWGEAKQGERGAFPATVITLI